MADFLLEMPKGELHLHLEGSLEPETLHELDPGTPLEELRALYRYADFDGFLKAFGEVGKRLRTPESYGLAARRLVEKLEAQNVLYAEIIVAAGVVLWKNAEFEPIFQAICDGVRDSNVEVRWILDAVRQFGVEHTMSVAKLAAERVDRGVIAFGIGGSEERGPAELFTDVFAYARDAGLHLTAHAGETGDPESIRAALRLGAERIGHGIAAARDRDLMSELADMQIPLEICITSNLVTGVVKKLEDHPIRRLYDAGIPILLNTDDPAMFGCTLTGEYALAQRVLGFTESELRGIAANAFRFAFAGDVTFPTV